MDTAIVLGNEGISVAQFASWGTTSHGMDWWSFCVLAGTPDVPQSSLMQWILLVGALVVVLLLLWGKRGGLVAEDQARQWLEQGARVVDVRTEAEFSQRHIPGAVNVPLSGIKEQIGTVAPQKEEILLLHCVAGGRSAMAQRTLKEMGYTRCYNLGSYGRAERIVSAAKTTKEQGTSDAGPKSDAN
jgi:phage shock protein E